jgi:hypothetical protein
LVVRAPAGRSLPAPGSFCNRGRKSQTGLAHSVLISHLLCARANNRHEARRIAANIAKLPELCARLTVGFKKGTSVRLLLLKSFDQQITEQAMTRVMITQTNTIARVFIPDQLSDLQCAARKVNLL